VTQPDLLDLLRQRVEQYNQQLGGKGGNARAAADLGYSDSALSQALSGKYKGNLDNLLARVEEIYGAGTVECPVLGQIALGKCAEHQRRPFAATNPVRVRLYRACQGCQHGGRR
jgi:hypothetical protein